jgi:hypothetical protein
VGRPCFWRRFVLSRGFKGPLNLGFSSKGLSKEELALFDGGGKTTKHLVIKSLGMDRERIVKLLNLIKEK